MNSLNVIQHTSADYLGLMEDHLEGGVSGSGISGRSPSRARCRNPAMCATDCF